MVPENIAKDLYKWAARQGQWGTRQGRRLRGLPWLWLGLWAVPLLWFHSPQQSLMAPEEALYAQQGWDMLFHNDWITLGWWGSPQFDRTPGLPWLIALSYHWFGRSEWAARLPSLVASVAALGLTWRLGRRLGPAATGLWAAAILAVMPLWAQASRLAVPDLLWVSLTLLAIWALLHSEDHPAQRLGWGMVAGTALSLGFLAQGAMVLLPMVALLPYLVWGHRTHRHLTNLGLYYGLALGAVPAVIWLGRSAARYGPVPLHQLGASWATRWGMGAGGALPLGLQSPWAGAYHLWHLPATTLPWLGFALVGAALVGRHRWLGRRTLWLGYPLVLWGLLTLTHARSSQADLPLYPFMALLAAVGLNHLGRLFRSAAAGRYRVAVGLSWVAGVAGILLLSAGAAVVITPGELIAAALRPYGWLGVAGGIGLLLPWLLAVYRWPRVSRPQQMLWQWSWLLGPWLAVAAAGTTGIFGDYSPAVKQALQSSPVAQILADNPVHMVQPRGDRLSVLLTVYTPQLGKPLGNWSQIPAEGYAWGDPERVPGGEGYEVIATVEGWQLVRAPVMPGQVPRG